MRVLDEEPRSILLNFENGTCRSMPDRRFPPPWIVEDSGAAFIAKTGTIVRRTQLRSTFENVPVLLKAPHVQVFFRPPMYRPRQPSNGLRGPSVVRHP
jgi:hypothetical protein